MFPKITHVFFDIGSTLVDETECYNHRIYDAVAGTDITFEQFTEKRIFFQKQNLKGDLEAIKFFGLKKTPWHREDERLYPETEEILQYLHDKNYIIGAIANQDFGTEKHLEEYGIRSYFNTITASAEEEVAKPDPEIFRRAFKSAGCSAGRRAGGAFNHSRHQYADGTRNGRPAQAARLRDAQHLHAAFGRRGHPAQNGPAPHLRGGVSQQGSVFLKNAPPFTVCPGR